MVYQPSMGLLRATRGDRKFCMGTQVLVGRGAGCDLQLDSRLASAPHALIHWTTAGWALRDIGSRNGTWLGDDRLEPARDVLLSAGARLSFGDRSEGWELVGADPPGPVAIGEDGALALAAAGLLALPEPERPSVVVLPDPDGWVVERDDELGAARDGQVLEVEGRRWTLLLPHTPVEAPAASTLDAMVDDVGRVVLAFSVSQDEEHVDVEVLSPGARVPLSARNHHFVLLALARAREEDARQGASEAERGWVYQDDLCRMVGVEATLLNLHLFRAREQLASAGLGFAARLIERRRLSRQVRLGPFGVEIRQGGGSLA